MSEIKATLVTKNPSSVKFQPRNEKNVSIGMVTVSGDVAKPFFLLPIGTEVAITVTVCTAQTTRQKPL